MPRGGVGGGMRHLPLSLILGGVMAMAGLAGAQTPPPASLPSKDTIPSGSLQEQLNSQQKDIENLIKTVGALTAQLQQARLATTKQAADSEEAWQVGAKQPDLELASGTIQLAQASEDLRKTQQALAELDKRQAAAAQAPADEQSKKQLELQRKQIDLLDK